MLVLKHASYKNIILILLGNKNSEIMAGKPKLHYTKGRGKMESIRWLLAAAGVEVCTFLLIKWFMIKIGIL